MPNIFRKCYFIDKLEKDFPFLIEQKRNKSGRSDILQHALMKNHELAEVSRSSSQSSQSFFVDKYLMNNVKWTAAEGMLALHTVKYNHSFISMDCISSVLRFHEKKKLTCSRRTRCRSTVVNVLALSTVRQICKELEEAKYMCVMVDTQTI